MSTERYASFWVLHFLAWSAIALLLFGIREAQIQRQRQQALAMALERSARHTVPKMMELNDISLELCIRMLEAYPRPESRKNIETILLATRLLDSCQHTLTNLRSDARSSIDIDKAAMPPDTFWNRLAAMSGDSARAASSFDKDWSETYSWGGDWLNILARNPSRSERLALLGSLELRNILAWRAFMNAFAQKVSFETVFAPFHPVLVPQSCPVVGGLYKTEIFLLELERFPMRQRIIRFEVNDRNVPQMHGRFQYAETFAEAGLHPLNISVEIRDPRTGQLKTYERDYILNVRPKK